MNRDHPSRTAAATRRGSAVAARMVADSKDERPHRVVASTQERALSAVMRPRGLIGCGTTLVHRMAVPSGGLGLPRARAAHRGGRPPRSRMRAATGWLEWLLAVGTRPGHRVGLWIRRGRCSRCLRSHALLPDFLLERRARWPRGYACRRGSWTTFQRASRSVENVDRDACRDRKRRG
jgi:hypothetical protein